MKQCSLYVIATIVDGEKVAPIKIGIAKDPKRRLGDFQTASPTELGIALDMILQSRDAAADLEKACHAIAKKVGVHIRGEWINLSPDNIGGLLGCGIDLACNSKLRGWREYDREAARLAASWHRLQAWTAEYFARPENAEAS